MEEKQLSAGLFSWLFPCFMGADRDKETQLYQAPSSDGDSITQKSIQSTFSTSEATPSTDGVAVVFTMAELNKATSNFSSSLRIGQGGFGVVYRGKLTDGRMVAIKRARKDLFEKRLTSQFQSEVNMLANVEHLSLVKLIGYLEQGDERIIVQEYVSNGNLRQHLDCQFGTVLDFSTRLDIAIDVSHGLTYLHLYADSLRAKVADFGFSRVGPMDSGATHVVTQVKGTAGYLDPEYLKTYKLSVKSDVYAFGILMVELLTGRRPIEHARDLEEKITLRWAYGKFQSGKVEEILDPRLQISEALLFVVEKMLELAFQCSAPTRNDRPTMQQASEYLWMVRKDFRALSKE